MFGLRKTTAVCICSTINVEFLMLIHKSIKSIEKGANVSELERERERERERATCFAIPHSPRSSYRSS
jgi:hypothetical protein